MESEEEDRQEKEGGIIANNKHVTATVNAEGNKRRAIPSIRITTAPRTGAEMLGGDSRDNRLEKGEGPLVRRWSRYTRDLEATVVRDYTIT